MSICDYCGKEVPEDEVSSCDCGRTLCEEHAAPELHECEAIDPDWRA